MNVGLALHQLQAEMSFEELLFWGKVEGCLTDYFLAVGVNYLGHANFA